jgi:RNA polymerase sigma-70 factor (ECF subfamily)
VDLETLSDPELIDRCRNDRQATHASFRALYERYSPAVLRFLRGLLSEDLARDALQESFLRVYGQLERYDTQRAFRPWILGIARNVALDLRRRRARRPAASLEGEVSDPNTTSPEGEARKSEARTLLAASVGRLAEREREVFLLKQVEGLTFVQVAEAVGCSVRTAKYRMKAAVEWLEQDLRRSGLDGVHP